jgi:hypothetical protein
VPSVVTVTAGREKWSPVCGNLHTIGDPVANVVVPDFFMADILRDGWQVKASSRANGHWPKGLFLVGSNCVS